MTDSSAAKLPKELKNDLATECIRSNHRLRVDIWHWKLFDRFHVVLLPLHERGARLTVAQKSRHTAHYETFLARHRKLPGVNVEKLSLMPGDPGYVLWACERSLRDGVSEAVALQFEGDELARLVDQRLHSRLRGHIHLTPWSYVDNLHSLATIQEVNATTLIPTVMKLPGLWSCEHR
ncbi:Fungal specific transcription factor domain family protein [Aspergillus niger]|uniref:Uncharacterized protein n=3 Tax=Aspergillus TaxID=5052 RepID=A2R1Y1_ASPNC|nr:uncharacterized protein BO96DRAFT_431092 [Aspergillus niger CBS 101883]XP_059602141.1 hypothetical protein An13g02850 [Aspergillus niger]RDK40265.1 hypothetical protein M752DRAFT_303811 [Aspergillus phoenicis ATCC 13157]PYH59997.1 hypothetical protein BO96DRAFT_431092 [Aspergillus niger CBS 101883]TPR05750.1 Fungal specific transcription factor domain family protein [Aspergillus niger]CAK41681.1 hypothetical protein An13g02850 [Aspergillus niger]